MAAEGKTSNTLTDMASGSTSPSAPQPGTVNCQSARVQLKDADARAGLPAVEQGFVRVGRPSSSLLKIDEAEAAIHHPAPKLRVAKREP
ncbi:hypothetical protein VTN00DRAFT_1543 [Thermoascus crustaceus]|uniref:uncharacterized protein n=1 Tax=Thermoascus crustaceus TaxID=5088 RepID=UPI003742A495